MPHFHNSENDTGKGNHGAAQPNHRAVGALPDFTAKGGFKRSDLAPKACLDAVDFLIKKVEFGFKFLIEGVKLRLKFKIHSIHLRVHKLETMVNRHHILLRCQPVPHGGIQRIGVRPRGSLVDTRFFQRIDIGEAIKAARGIVHSWKNSRHRT
jgi:hypothetical protein